MFKVFINLITITNIGCPEPKKEIFLRDLMQLLHRKMKSADPDSNETFAKWQVPKEERTATWHFVMMDINKNKVNINVA